MSEAATIERAEALMAQGKTAEAVSAHRSVGGGPGPQSSFAGGSFRRIEIGPPQRRGSGFRPPGDRAVRIEPDQLKGTIIAATLDDLGRARRAVKAVEEAFRLGLDAPQAFALYARASARGQQSSSSGLRPANQRLCARQQAVEVASVSANYVCGCSAATWPPQTAMLDLAFERPARLHPRR